MCYTVWVHQGTGFFSAPQLMRLRRAVPKISSRSSVPPGLPVYKIHHRLTHSESTLPQVLIPLHFNSPRINTYKKPGRGPTSKGPIFCKVVTTHTSPCCTRRNSRNSIRFKTLLHSLRTPGVGAPVPNEGLLFSLDLLNRQLSAPNFRLLHEDFSSRRYPLASLLHSSVLPSPPHPGAIHA
jgi:hypothetical protein